jgi:hypothetical protein
MKTIATRIGRVIAAASLVAVVVVVVTQAVGASPTAPAVTIKALLTRIAADSHATRLAVADKSTGLAEIKREVRAIEAASGALEVSAQIEEGYCATGGVQCGAAGDTFTAASSANHNPVRVVLLVTESGAPVTGLASTSFDFADGIVPAGGSALAVCVTGDPSCGPSSSLSDAGNGLYVAFLRKATTGDWKAGSYFGRFTVTDAAGHKGSVLVRVTIP